MEPTRLQRRERTHFNRSELPHLPSVQHWTSSLRVRYPDKKEQWSQALHNLFAGIVPQGNEDRSALVRECANLGESIVLRKLLRCAPPSTLILNEEIEREGLSALAKAASKNVATTGLIVSAICPDHGECESLRDILFKMQLTSVTFKDGAHVPEGLQLRERQDALALWFLEVDLPVESKHIGSLLGPIMANSASLRKMKITFSDMTAGQELEQTCMFLVKTSTALCSLEIELPDAACSHVLACCLPFLLHSDSIQSLAFPCRKAGVPSREVCGQLGSLLKDKPSLREFSLTNWTDSSEGAAQLAPLFLAVAEMKGIVRLDLHGNRGFGNRDDGKNPVLQEMLRLLKLNPGLQTLNLTGTAETLFSCQELAQLLSDNQTLTSLALPELSKDFDVKELSDAVNKNTTLRSFSTAYVPEPLPLTAAIANAQLYKALVETVQRNRRNYLEMLSHAGLHELLDRHLLVEEVVDHVSKMGLDPLSGARLTLLNHAARDMAREAEKRWQLNKLERRQQGNEG